MRPDDVCACPTAPTEVPEGQSATGLPDADLRQLITHLYVCRGQSTYRIGELTGIGRQRVGRMLSRAGVPVKPRGEGRPRSRDDQRVTLDQLMTRLYVEARLSSVQISALTGVPHRTVRARLRAAGVRMRTRGGLNREDRTAVPVDALMRLYVGAGLSAADAGRLLGVSRQVVLRTAHDEGVPVRIGGPQPSHGPTEIELVKALYDDPLVRSALARHGVASRPAGGPIWRRFPVPLPVSSELAAELYVECGLAVRHIELVTGQAAQTVLRKLHANGITPRPPGGRSPFMRRWRTPM